MKWPKRIKHRNKVLATIYRKSKSYPFYRLSYYSAGKRHLQSFSTYSEAKTKADKLVTELAKGSLATALSPAQARDALAALERLEAFRVSTGQRVSLLRAVSEYVEASSKLPHGCSFAEAVDGYQRTVATVKRKDLAVAVKEFIAADESRIKAGDGKRAQLSPKYSYNRAIMLRRFAAAFPNSAVSDLVKEHLDKFFAAKPLLGFSGKSRNHHRAAILQFLQWCIRKDYLSGTHRLCEADSMLRDSGDASEIEFYTPSEFQALLENAEGPMRAMIALGGLAGLRTAELLRLNWDDTRRVENHIEITSSKSKTRQRRLVPIVPALAQWLVEFKGVNGKIWSLHEITFQQHFVDLCEKTEVEVKPKQKAKVKRKPNGLRHSFVTYHFAAHGNENLTAAEAGNSPAMIHKHYRGLATKKEGVAWFSIAPKQAENVIPFAAAAIEKK